MEQRGERFLNFPEGPTPVKRLVALLGAVTVLGAAALLLDLSGAPAGIQAETVEKRVKRYASMRYEGARQVVLDKGSRPDSRTAAMRDLVKANARAAPAVIAEVLEDRDAEVRRAAAEWLAIYGDKRGLDVQAECLKANVSAGGHHHAARLLGAEAKPAGKQVRAARLNWDIPGEFKAQVNPSQSVSTIEWRPADATQRYLCLNRAELAIMTCPLLWSSQYDTAFAGGTVSET